MVQQKRDICLSIPTLNVRGKPAATLAPSRRSSTRDKPRLWPGRHALQQRLPGARQPAHTAGAGRPHTHAARLPQPVSRACPCLGSRTRDTRNGAAATRVAATMTARHMWRKPFSKLPFLAKEHPCSDCISYYCAERRLTCRTRLHAFDS